MRLNRFLMSIAMMLTLAMLSACGGGGSSESDSSSTERIIQNKSKKRATPKTGQRVFNFRCFIQ